MNSTPQQQQQIEQYLHALQSHLHALPEAERQEILRELEAHVRDAADLHGTPPAVTLARLGPPRDLALQYAEGASLRHPALGSPLSSTRSSTLSSTRSSTLSRAPSTLLAAALRLATRGLSGLVLFLLALTGYCIGAALLLTALLKAFLPGKIGLWVHNGDLDAAGLQLVVPPAPAHEVLGRWYMLAGAVAGVLLLLATTWLLRRGLRWTQRIQQRLRWAQPVAAAI